MRIIAFILFFIFILPSISFAETVFLQWDANTEEDLAGYRLYYGNATGTYSTIVPIISPIVTGWTLTLNPGIYFFALTAYDFSGNESGYSNEVNTTINQYPTKPNQIIIINIL